jgi:YrhK-like protein
VQAPKASCARVYSALLPPNSTAKMATPVSSAVAPLLRSMDGGQEDKKTSVSTPVHDAWPWRIFHALGFATGGTTFIAGTAMYWLPADNAAAALAGGILYTIGSAGFLSVDVLEAFTFKECPLRGNILMSAAGSTCYILGSIGFLPEILNNSNLLGVWGFILGSALIFVSQCWKVARLSAGPNGWPSLKAALANKDVATAIGVEAGACLGALFFLIGTIIYGRPDATDGMINTAIWLWMVGSVAFTTGAAFLSWRHFVMRIT